MYPTQIEFNVISSALFFFDLMISQSELNGRTNICIKLI
jgi:hypothetical protein